MYAIRSYYDDSLGLSLDDKTMADYFKANGYHTYSIGKWHLGGLPPYHPNKRGFDDFYGFLSGSRSYFYDKKMDNDSVKMLQHNGSKVVFNNYLTYELGRAASEFVKAKSEIV